MSYIKKRISAFGYAFNGLWYSFKSEAHLKIQLLAALVVIVLGFYFSVTSSEWAILLICCGSVISLELVNSAIEKLCDLITTEQNPKIKYIKDVMAGAVLVASMTAAVIGILIFYPYFKQFIS